MVVLLYLHYNDEISLLYYFLCSFSFFIFIIKLPYVALFSSLTVGTVMLSTESNDFCAQRGVVEVGRAGGGGGVEKECEKDWANNEQHHVGT